MNSALLCLALTVYYEARGEIPDGQIAVAETVINRVEDSRWPDSICGVVTQNRHPTSLHRCQFSFYCDGKPEQPGDAIAWQQAQDIAEAVIEGNLSLGIEATHYHTTHTLPVWADSMESLGTVGDHVFYSEAP